MPAMSAQQITPAGPCGVIEHDDEFTERDVELSVFLAVASGTTAEPPLEIPQRDCLVARVVGPYDQVSQAHDLIAERMVADGLSRLRDGSLAAKCFNRYLSTPDQVGPEELVTEVCVPLA